MPEDKVYMGTPSLGGAEAVLTDLRVASRKGEVPVVSLGQDGWKAPDLFDEKGSPQLERPTDPSEDIWAFGKLLHALADATEGDPDYLRGTAHACMHPEAAKRPRAGPSLILRISPDWGIQEVMARGGYEPESHRDFVGRKFVFQPFREFRTSSVEHGGVFVIEGEPGVGKTALLNEWARREGRSPSFFFGKGRNSELAMIQVLLEATCRRYQLEQSVPEAPRKCAAALQKLLKRVSDEKMDPDDTLLLFVDAIDECADAERAIELLPRPPLPRGVFLVVASRPAAGDRDHLKSLLRAGPRHFPLRAEDDSNKADVTAYVEAKLGSRLQAGQA
jgi:hypothetical protein